VTDFGEDDMGLPGKTRLRGAIQKALYKLSWVGMQRAYELGGGPRHPSEHYSETRVPVERIVWQWTDWLMEKIERDFGQP
jgi:hypothetical protein